jgi:hypothetical protein
VKNQPLYQCKTCKLTKFEIAFSIITKKLDLKKQIKQKYRVINRLQKINSKKNSSFQIQNKLLQSKENESPIKTTPFSSENESNIPFMTIEKFRVFLNKMQTAGLNIISNMFTHYSKIFDKEFKIFFRSKSNIFTRFHSDLEKKLKLKIAHMFTNKSLIYRSLDIPEGSVHDKSLSAFFSEHDQRDLLSQNFSSMLSIDRIKNPESLSLILEYSQSDLEDNKNKTNDFNDGRENKILNLKNLHLFRIMSLIRNMS